MTMATYIINYLPAAIIVLLLAVLVVLVRMLMKAANRQKSLESEIIQLRAQKMHEIVEKKDSRTEEYDEQETVVTLPEQLPDNVFIAYVDQLITRNILKNDFTANTVAQVMHLSRTQLDRRLKQLSGKTTTAYLLDKRMIYARELLLTTDMPIAEVATACGFDDTSYFTRVFRNHYNITPSELRKGK